MPKMRSYEWDRIPESTKNIIRELQKNLPIKLGSLTKELGLIVKVATMPSNISGEIGPDENAESGFKIRINKHEYKTRQRFTLAHEIAHFLLHSDQIGEGIKDNVLFRSSLSDKTEAEANRLAADILMPWNMLEEQIKLIDENHEDPIKQLADSFGVSEHAMRIRLGKN